jgi:cyclopropane fatty-acyl-phospholipid synthase-like methyltransferase
MSGADQARVVEAQFGPRAEAYLQSAVHAQGADLTAFAALLDGSPTARLLDLGCGGGHMAFAAAPHVAEVVAYDLSSEMLAVVARAAAERDLTNLVTQRGRAESTGWRPASAPITGPTGARASGRRSGCSGPAAVACSSM